MTPYTAKLRYLLPYFLIITLTTIFGTLAVRWLFTIAWPILDLKQEVWEIWLPIALPWIPILAVLRNKFKILSFENSNGPFLFQILSWACMTLPMIISQLYFTTASSDLRIITKLDEVHNYTTDRFFDFKKFTVDTDQGGAHSSFRVKGRYNDRLDIDVYFVFPIKDTIVQQNPALAYWYGIKYSKEISNKISDEEKQTQYEKFYNESAAKLDSYPFYSLLYFERVANSDDRDGYFKAIESQTQKETDNEATILIPINESFENRNGSKLTWALATYAFGILLFALLLRIPKYNETEHQRLLKRGKPQSDDFTDALQYLIPSGDHFATSVIIDLNLLVFILMVFSGVNIVSPDANDLLTWGANRRADILNGEWWRLISNTFVHIGVMHLFLNLYGLIIGSMFVEPRLGKVNFFVLYIVSGICGSIASIAWHPDTVSAGASGAIFGLYGAVLGLLLTKAFPKEEKKSIFAFVGIYAVINLLWGLTGGIDNAAHLGGLVSGMVTGIILFQVNPTRKIV
jgi:rhomboid protease GluP